MNYFVEFPKLGLEFTINPEAFSIGGISIRWYGILLALGFLLGFLYALKSSSKLNIDPNKLFDAVIVGAICAVLGARLYYVIFYDGDKFINNPMEIFNIRDGGLGFYGSLIGGLVGGGVMCKIKKLKMAAVFDLAALGFLIGQAIGRWANFINQEAFGVATELPWGMHSERTAAVVSGNVHPCFLYESLWCVLGFVILHIFTRKFRRYDGQTFLLYIIWYGMERFFIEGLRTDSLMIPNLNLRVSQVLALVSALVAIVMLFVFRHKTSLTGCGSKKVMEANAIVIGGQKEKLQSEKKEDEEKLGEKEEGDKPKKSTIFTDENDEKPDGKSKEEGGKDAESEGKDESETSENAKDSKEEKGE